MDVIESTTLSARHRITAMGKLERSEKAREFIFAQRGAVMIVGLIRPLLLLVHGRTRMERRLRLNEPIPVFDVLTPQACNLYACTIRSH